MGEGQLGTATRDLKLETRRSRMEGGFSSGRPRGYVETVSGAPGSHPTIDAGRDDRGVASRREGSCAMKQIGMLMLAVGLLLVVGGVVFLLAGRMPFPGRLPGDIQIRFKHGAFSFPLVTCIVASIVLTIILNVLLRLFRR
jgi:hypothetical protein